MGLDDGGGGGGGDTSVPTVIAAAAAAVPAAAASSPAESEFVPAPTSSSWFDFDCGLEFASWP